jgi:hypothetical protein
MTLCGTSTSKKCGGLELILWAILFSAGGNSSHVLSDGDVKYLEVNVTISKSSLLYRTFMMIKTGG